MSYDDHLPIAYFAHTGCYNEQNAIQIVATELGLEVVKFDPALTAKAITLLDSSPCSDIVIDRWDRARAVPIDVFSDRVVVAMANPTDWETIRSFEFELHRRVQPVIAAEKEVRQVFMSRSSAGDQLNFDVLIQDSKPLEIKNTSIPSSQTNANQESNISSEDISAPPVIKLVNRIFAAAIHHGASDLHISPEHGRVMVRMRVDGITRDLLEVPTHLKNAVISRIKVLCGLDITEKRQPQDGRLRLKTHEGSRDLRISTVPTIYGEDLVARILSNDIAFTTYESLGMPPAIREMFTKALSHTAKVFLVAGPTGSGKTSTLYASLLYKRDGASRMITIEDPIEYRVAGVSQIQVNSKVGLDFAKALRSVLRQDPDVILLGEIRDGETASIAMQSAMTGHLVLSTIHTNSAVGGVTRLRDLGVPSYLMASSLGGILAQRLVRRMCPHCQVPIEDAAMLKRYSELGLEGEMKKPKGCDECSSSGYRGRVGVFSFLPITPEVAKAIRDEKGEDVIEQAAQGDNYMALEDSAIELMRSGVTTLEEVERVLGPISVAARRSALARAKAAPAPETPAALPIAEPKEVPNVIQRRKVLFVDDDEDLRAVFQALLKFEMLDVATAEDGLAALESVFERMPDLIICDLMMPRMSGVEMIARLRSDPRTRHIPVLMLTAVASEDNELKVLESGADDFVSKTAKKEIIMARINRLLNR